MLHPYSVDGVLPNQAERSHQNPHDCMRIERADQLRVERSDALRDGKPNALPQMPEQLLFFATQRANGRNHRTQINFAKNRILQSSGALRLLGSGLLSSYPFASFSASISRRVPLPGININLPIVFRGALRSSSDFISISSSLTCSNMCTRSVPIS